MLIVFCVQSSGFEVLEHILYLNWIWERLHNLLHHREATTKPWGCLRKSSDFKSELPWILQCPEHCWECTEGFICSISVVTGPKKIYMLWIMHYAIFEWGHTSLRLGTGSRSSTRDRNSHARLCNTASYPEPYSTGKTCWRQRNRGETWKHLIFINVLYILFTERWSKRLTWMKFSFFSVSSKMLCTILMNLLLMISLSTSLHCNKLKAKKQDTATYATTCWNTISVYG